MEIASENITENVTGNITGNITENPNIRESEFSRLHPLVNFVYLAGVVAITIISNNPVMLFIAFVASLVYSLMLCGIKGVRKNLFLVIPILVFTVLIQPLFSHNGSTPLYYINDNAVTLEMIVYGLTVSVLLISMILWFACYNVLITSDKFLYLFGRIIPSLALVISMIFRMIPLLRHRFTEIDEAQVAMGKKTKKMGLYNHAKIFMKELSILIAWSLEASIDTSDSMEARGYGLKGRTSFHLFKWKMVDCVWIVAILLISGTCIYGIVEKSVQIYYFPTFKMNEMSIASYVTFISFAILAISPIIYDLGGKLKWRRLNSKM